MRIEEFQAIIARHKGLRDTPVAIDPETTETSEISGKQTKRPNPTPTYRYIFNDGTSLEARSLGGGEFQLSNPGTAENKAGVQDPNDPNKAPETKTFPDGTERQWDPAKRDWVVVATRPQGPAAATAPDIHTLPDGSQVQFNPATGKWEPFASAKPAAAGPAPGTEAIPAARPGQTTDLGAVKAVAQHTWDTLTADVQAGRITTTERDQRWNAYYEGTVKPALESATREANAEAARQQQRQQASDTLAQQAAARASRTEDRQSTTAERAAKTAEDRLALDTQTASYNRGQDAVSNALKLLQYQVDPSFSPALAGIYNRIMPGAFQPNAFQTALPDIDAIAQAHVGPLLDMHASPVTGPSAQAGPAVPPGYPPAQPGQPDPLANVPITPRAPYPQPGGTGVVGRFGQ